MQCFDKEKQGICGAQHPPVHRLRAALVRLWTGGIGDSRAFLPPLTRIGSTLAVQRGHPAVLGEALLLVLENNPDRVVLEKELELPKHLQPVKPKANRKK